MFGLIYYNMTRNVLTEMTIDEKKETVNIRHGLIVPHRKIIKISDIQLGSSPEGSSGLKIHADGQTYSLPNLEKYYGISLTNRSLLESVVNKKDALKNFKYALAN